MDDLELWQRYIEGNKSSFEEIYYRYYSSLLSYGQRLGFDEDSIQDCIQDLFVKIYVNRKTLSPTLRLKPYLYRCLINALVDTTRYSYSKTIPLDEFVDISIEDSGLLALCSKNDEEYERFRHLKDALNQLTIKQKNALYFRFIQDFTWDEMSVMFKMSVHSCMNLVGRGICKMQQILKQSSDK